MMLKIDDDRFEQLVGMGIDAIPDDLLAQMNNVAIVIEDISEDGDESLLGEYVGIPLTERYDYSAVMPDMIKIYRFPLRLMCETEEQIVEEVKVTVVHEVAHHFGFDDAQLHELGWS